MPGEVEEKIKKLKIEFPDYKLYSVEIDRGKLSARLDGDYRITDYSWNPTSGIRIKLMKSGESYSCSPEELRSWN